MRLAEGILALMVAATLGALLFLYTGENLRTDATQTTQPIVIDEAAAARGERLAAASGCLACHSIDGTRGSGPTWEGLAGSTRPLASGETVTADDAYLFASIIDPAGQVVAGFDAIMPPDYGESLTETEIEDLVEYIKSLRT